MKQPKEINHETFKQFQNLIDEAGIKPRVNLDKLNEKKKSPLIVQENKEPEVKVKYSFFTGLERGFLLFIPVLMLLIVYFLFAIYYLYKNHKIAMKCDSSHLFSFVSLVLIQWIISFIYLEKLGNIIPYNMNMIGGIIYSLVFIFWGFREIFQMEKCVLLQQSGLWWIGLVTWIIFILISVPRIYQLYLVIKYHQTYLKYAVNVVKQYIKGEEQKII